jgi:hypothetical protein
MSRYRWTKDRILLEIRRQHARGEDLSVRRMRAIGLGGMVTTAYRLFGTWRRAIAEAGVAAPVVRARRWSVERIVAEIRRLAGDGNDTSYSEARRVAPALVSAAYRHPELGNWSKALEAAGLSPEGSRPRERWTRQKIVDEIQGMEDSGASLAFGAARELNSRLVGAACSRRHFGSWGGAVRAAGFDYDAYRARRRWTRERIIATIKHLHAGGVALTTSSVRRSGWSSLLEAARKPTMFGSWREAVECAGIDYEQVRRASETAGIRD